MRRFGVVAGLCAAGTLAGLLAAGRAEAAGPPEVTAILEGLSTQDLRPMRILVGRRLGAIRTFTLKDGGGADAGLVDVVHRRSTEIGLALPPSLAPGAYTLELTFGREGMQSHPVTIPAEVYLTLADGGTVAGPLSVTSEDGVLFGGTLGGAGAIPASGAGTRFLWHPAKGALRAGHVDGTQWDDGNVGATSVAFGRNTRASGLHALAAGDGATASGERSVAMGDNTVASGFGAFAVGDNSTASAFGAFAAGGNGPTASADYAVAMGAGTTASGFAAFAAGNFTTASANYAVALGAETTASGLAAFAAGNGATASGVYTVALGGETTASGFGAFAAGGFGSTASGTYAVSLGINTESSAFSSFAGGSGSTASADYAVAMGTGTTASGFASFAAGSSTTATGDGATALGGATTAQSHTSLVIGRFNVIAGDRFSPVATDPLFVAGNGASAAAPSNALTLLRNGNMTIAGTLTQNSDARLKTDVVPLAGVLPRLARVRAVAFRFRDGDCGPEGPQVGLLAQEVREVFPELVHEASDGTLSVAYGKFTAVLLAAVKEQQEEIEVLREELKRRQDDVAARLERLERLAAQGVADAPR